VKAARNAGMRVGLYYSPMDWRFPGYFDPKGLPDNAALMKKQTWGQVEELMTRYGHIDVLWYEASDALRLFAMRFRKRGNFGFQRAEQLQQFTLALVPDGIRRLNLRFDIADGVLDYFSSVQDKGRLRFIKGNHSITFSAVPTRLWFQPGELQVPV
jgi:hypothetical protein